MKPSLQNKLQQLAYRLDEISGLLADQNATADMAQYRKLNQEHSELMPVVGHYNAWQKAQADLTTAEGLLGDPEMKEFAQDEIEAAKQRLLELDAELQILLLPRDPNDERNIFLEVRAGTGGNESALFAGDLFRMYARYAERQRWKVEIVSASDGEVGGYKEIIARIVGQGAYSKLKFESGGHRVQRVPDTETQGRIHTSACTVAVLPEAEEVELEIPEKDIRVDRFRSSGPGGQSVNTTDSAIRVTHIPTGLIVQCQDDRSQHKNKAQALSVLAARLKDQQEREAHAKEASTRKSLIGTGDRSDRIRTYNFPQGRVTDHRINLTLYKIDSIMEGGLDELINALTAEHQTELLSALSGEE